MFSLAIIIIAIALLPVALVVLFYVGAALLVAAVVLVGVAMVVGGIALLNSGDPQMENIGSLLIVFCVLIVCAIFWDHQRAVSPQAREQEYARRGLLRAASLEAIAAKRAAGEWPTFKEVMQRIAYELRPYTETPTRK